SVTSFTQIGPPPAHPVENAASLRPSQTLDEACLPLFAQQGYDADEMHGYFSQGNARCVGLYQNGQPIAACFTYQNYRHIWEIGGLYTLPDARQRGYGRSVVAAALNFLCQNNLMPRYQVHEGNFASVKLAVSLQLKPALHTTHYLIKW
ncbi:MAG: GNAT family N-acetyltransferase, partial [Anaerolineae bacterium]|nr:GNAT family N-acetyltransferase [Anaerolineae bacterium]